MNPLTLWVSSSDESHLLCSLYEGRTQGVREKDEGNIRHGYAPYSGSHFRVPNSLPEVLRLVCRCGEIRVDGGQ